MNMTAYNTRVANEMNYLRAAKNGSMPDLLRLDVAVQNPMIWRSAAVEAAKAGHVACMEHLIARAADDTIYDQCLRSAVVGGHAQCVEWLAPKSTLDVVYSVLLNTVRMRNHECFDMLREYAALSQHQTLFHEAVLCNNHHAFHTLLPLVDPKCNDSLALQLACLKQHIELFDKLYLVSDPIAARAQLTASNTLTDLLDARIEQDRLNAVLTQATNNEYGARAQRKI